MLPHARESSRQGYDPDGPVVMAPFRGCKLGEFPSQPEIKRSCQWMDTPTSSSTVTAVSGSGGEVVGRRCVRTGETQRWRTSTVRKNYDDHSLRPRPYHLPLWPYILAATREPSSSRCRAPYAAQGLQ
ncbi:hypothetical protein EVAR_44259_1 [Eumeta japonica]|uniref:Uncharacterized protein n=1 Tax=Eumeta variegata TaxID=151549 RepID=A0A4C1XCE5_EUMVA|nr:hypothetical protein EVAR_44259_1 [Eumeta japonica]